MKTTAEKFTELDAFIVATGMTEEELTKWYESRSLKVIGEPPFKMFGIKDNKLFEVTPSDKDWRSEVKLYELLPNIFVAKKCGTDRKSVV